MSSWSRSLALAAWLITLIGFTSAAGGAVIYVPGTEPGAENPHRLPAEYLIVTDDPLQGHFQRFAEWKTRHGTPAEVVTLAAIRGAYPVAADDAERVRLAIRDAHAAGVKWVLLGGDTEVIPTRIAHTTFLGGHDFASDLYFACLDGSWNADGDSFWGEGFVSPSDPGDAADLAPEVWVGRAPVRTPDEALVFVDKTMRYATASAGEVSRTALLFAEVLFPRPWTGGPITLDGASLAEDQLASLSLIPGAEVVRLYENYADPSWSPGGLPLTRASGLEALARGPDLAVHVGGGSEAELSVGGGERIESADLSALANVPRYSNFYSIGASVNAIQNSAIGEAFVRAPDGGAVTSVGGSTLTFVINMSALLGEFVRLLAREGVDRIGELVGRQSAPVLPQTTFDGTFRMTVMSMVLLGDPQLALHLGGMVADADAIRLRPRFALSEAQSPARDTALELFPTRSGDGRVRLEFSIPADRRGAPGDLSVFDLGGRHVRTLWQGPAEAGRRIVEWDLSSDSGAPTASGVYYARIRVASEERVQSVAVIR